MKFDVMNLFKGKKKEEVLKYPWYKYFDSFDRTGLDNLQPFDFVMWGSSPGSDSIGDQLQDKPALKVVPRKIS